MTGSSDRAQDNREFMACLRSFKVDQLAPGSLLAQLSASQVRGWCVALDRASRLPERQPAATRKWIDERLRTLATAPASDAQRSVAAEVDAGLRLSWIGEVERVPEGKTRSIDFKVAGLHVEVFCPQEHTEERRVVEADLAQQLERSNAPVKVAVAISHPTTGSGRTVDTSGAIQRIPGSNALAFPSNKVIDRVLHKKRDGLQFTDGQPNALWLDLKHGLRLSAIDCIPFRSMIAKGTCFTGAHGIWHGFYGETGSPFFPERTALEWPVGIDTYEQQQPGWFRELRKVSATIVSLSDGVLLFENPWASTPLLEAQRRSLFRLSELRAELSWSDCTGTLERDVASMLARLAWLAELARERDDDEAPPTPTEGGP